MFLHLHGPRTGPLFHPHHHLQVSRGECQSTDVTRDYPLASVHATVTVVHFHPMHGMLHPSAVAGRQ